ncbi:unnamed protein product [Paramecium pentaurelia]|uniref:Uncharacterized protein n=1 Tax=Paramecium pentaurelia TaxID=43138 RepID=A0A8S1U2C9_9CILI|nr:unnamed protein product [Paramecium pentaurelia]
MVIIILSLQYASLLKCITLASGSADKSIRLWNIITGQQIQILNSESSTIFSVHFSTDGSTLASGSMDNSINLWDVNTGKQKVKLDENYNCISAVCFSSDCSILACGSVDKSISLWDFKIGKEIICSDKSYQEILLQFKHLFFQIIHNQKSSIPTSLFFLYLNSQYFKHHVLQS